MSPHRAIVHAVVVHHEGRDMLELALESLLESTGVELQVVVIQNGCDDREIPAIARDDGRVHVVRSAENLGFSEANNRGVSWARDRLGAADAYYFVNNDTRSTPEALERMLAALEERPKAAMAGPTVRILDHPDHLNSLGLNVTEDAWGWDEGIGLSTEQYLETSSLPEEPRAVLGVTGAALLLRADAYRRVGGWTELYGWYFEDIDLAIKVWKAGFEVVHVPDALVYHQISATMTVGAERKFFFFQRNRLYLAVVHWPADLLRRLLGVVLLEIRRGAPDERRRRAKALLATLARLPRLLLWRRKLRGEAVDATSWRRFLHPRGSVPVITLPSAESGSQAAEPLAAEPLAAEPLAAEPQAASLPDDVASALGAARDDRPRQDRVLVVGWGPLPDEPATMHLAPAHRTWQLARALADDGHAVCVVRAAIPGTATKSESESETESESESVTEADDVTLDRQGDLIVVRVPPEAFDEVADDPTDALVAACIDAFDPRLVVGAAPVPSRAACRAAGDRPVWVDVFGDPMAEAQARAVALDSDADIYSGYARMHLELLRRGDAFSAVSARQRDALLGQLGLAGRLTREVAGRDLVHVVPCAVPTGIAPATTVSVGPGVEDREPLVVWSGSFNTWCDLDTLFAALERAMDREPSLRFVATGGAVAGHDETTWERARERVAASRHAERMELLGGVSTRRLDEILERAALVVVTERRLLERELGSSGRLTEWLGRGLPLVSTRQSELGETIERERLGWTYEVGDVGRLAELLASAASLDRQDDRGRRAAAWAAEHLSIEATTRPFRRWARSTEADGARRPTLSLRLVTDAELDASARARDEARRAAAEAEAAYHQVRAELGTIHQSRMWAVWMTIHRLRATVRRLLPF